MVSINLYKETYSLVNSDAALDRDKWANFVLNHPDGNVFQTPEMYDVFEQSNSFTPILVAVVSEYDIKGILLAVIQREKKGIGSKFSQRAIIRGGPLIDGTNEKVMELILKEFNEKVKKSAIYTQIRNWTDTSAYKSIFRKHGFKFIDHLNLLVDLSQPEDVLWKEINHGKRRSIRKAYREGVKVELEHSSVKLNDSYAILKEVYQRIKLPFPEMDFFVKWQNHFCNETQFLIFTAKWEEEVLAFRYILAYKNVLYISYAGGIRKYTKKFANDLINWEIFLWGKSNGFIIFDFAGAGSPHAPYGVRVNKMRFGGKTCNLGRYEKIHKPRLYSFAKLAFSIWKNVKRK